MLESKPATPPTRGGQRHGDPCHGESVGCIMSRVTTTDVRTLILSDGGLASLIACAIACERACTDNAGSTCVMLVRAGDAFDAARNAAVVAQCVEYDLPRAEVTSELVLPADAGGEDLTRGLLEVAFGSLREGITRIIWPLHLGCPEDEELGETGEVDHSLDDLADRVDRALLVARLASLDAPRGSEVQIETPLIDLTDQQLGELGLDLAVPVELCWWWGPGKAGDQLPARLYRRWTTALRQIGWATADRN